MRQDDCRSKGKNCLSKLKKLPENRQLFGYDFLVRCINLPEVHIIGGGENIPNNGVHTSPYLTETAAITSWSGEKQRKALHVFQLIHTFVCKDLTPI